MRRRVRLTRARLAALAAACVVVVGAAFAAGWAVGVTAPRTAAAPSIPAPPSPPPQPPFRHYQYMSGVTVSQITGVARAHGYACSGPGQYGQYLSEWFCRLDGGNLHGTVAIEARDQSRVWLVQVWLDDGGRAPGRDASLPLLTGLAPLPLSADAGVAAQATAWVTANVDESASTEFASLSYAMAPEDGCLFTMVAKW